MQMNDDKNDTCSSKFHLVDLAGSVRAQKNNSGWKAEYQPWTTLSLEMWSVLLYRRWQREMAIPYIDSELTRHLQDSFGSNSYIHW